MNPTDFQQFTQDRARRTTNYQEMVRKYYDHVTDFYRERWNDSFHFAVFQGNEPLEEAILATERMLAEDAGLRAGMKVLDVGCGVGGPALNIAEYAGVYVTGLNIVEKQVRIARQRAAERGLSAQTEFVLGDAMNMPFDDAAYDAVYVFEAGCHMPDKQRFYQECVRVLKPGGVFFGQDWFTKNNPTPQEEADYLEPICRLHGLPQMISLTECTRYLIEAGLEVERVENAASRGNILRNWEQMDRRSAHFVRRYLPFLLPRTLRMLIDGGVSLCRAAKVGAFILGIWQGRKPLANGGA
ncbi:MAG: SAM-dependent methyltransferase [Gemmataceae bacterium]